MGKLFSRHKNKGNQIQSNQFKNEPLKIQIEQKQQVGKEQSINNERVNRKIPSQPYDPKPVFKKIFEHQQIDIDKSFNLVQLVNNEVWNVNNLIIRECKILNVFELIEVCNSLALIIDGIPKMMAIVDKTQPLLKNFQFDNDPLNIWNNNKDEKSFDIEYKIYKDLFEINFAKLKKLKLVQKREVQSTSVILLQVLQYIQMPVLQELHVDSFRICNIRFLKKCVWKNLSTLTLRFLEVHDSQQFATILPYLASSTHLENVNLQPAGKANWSQINWIIKLGFNNAFDQKVKLQTDDEYYFKYNNKVLRRIQFGLHHNKLARRHLSMISKKFNNTHFDNPISFW